MSSVINLLLQDSQQLSNVSFICARSSFVSYMQNDSTVPPNVAHSVKVDVQFVLIVTGRAPHKLSQATIRAGLFFFKLFSHHNASEPSKAAKEHQQATSSRCLSGGNRLSDAARSVRLLASYQNEPDYPRARGSLLDSALASSSSYLTFWLLPVDWEVPSSSTCNTPSSLSSPRIGKKLEKLKQNSAQRTRRWGWAERPIFLRVKAPDKQRTWALKLHLLLIRRPSGRCRVTTCWPIECVITRHGSPGLFGSHRTAPLLINWATPSPLPLVFKPSLSGRLYLANALTCARRY